MYWEIQYQYSGGRTEGDEFQLTTCEERFFTKPYRGHSRYCCLRIKARHLTFSLFPASRSFTISISPLASSDLVEMSSKSCFKLAEELLELAKSTELVQEPPSSSKYYEKHRIAEVCDELKRKALGPSEYIASLAGEQCVH